MYQPARTVKAVDTTGAGDTFTGYYIAAVIEGKKVQLKH
ncbi:MAG: PfkB family carbohydrate kinase [Thomasclavelia ramosa]